MTITTGSDSTRPSIVSSIDAAQVKILLVPLNNFPENSWQKLVEKISEVRKVSLTNFQKRNEYEGTLNLHEYNLFTYFFD